MLSVSGLVADPNDRLPNGANQWRQPMTPTGARPMGPRAAERRMVRLCTDATCYPAAIDAKRAILRTASSVAVFPLAGNRRHIPNCAGRALSNLVAHPLRMECIAELLQSLMMSLFATPAC